MRTVNFTRGGDKGTTALYGGQRVPKDNAAIEALGTLDELNSVMGFATALFKDYFCHSGEPSRGRATPESDPGQARMTGKIQKFLIIIQNDLFDLQGLLAGYDKNYELRIMNYEKRVKEMEMLIAELDNDLPSLKNFILPGGTVAGAYFHICRTVCRRAERRVFSYLDSKIKLENFSDAPIKYLNRLSSLFFVIARFVNQAMNAAEKKWIIQSTKNRRYTLAAHGAKE